MDSLSSLYLHFPFCGHLCNYCDFYKLIDTDRAGYHDFLEKSFSVHEELMKKNHYSWNPLETLYIGGGTPSLWGRKGAVFFKDFLKERLSLVKSCEFTMEMNPGSMGRDDLLFWMEMGVNRISLGVQSLQEDFLSILDRTHSLCDSYKALELLSELGMDFSVDFMLGLPWSESKKRNILLELKSVLEFNPTHLSLYILTVYDNYIHHHALPSESWIEREYLESSSFLMDRGFSHYEVSNFARMGKKSRHNMKYWQSSPMGALGPSATGLFPKKNHVIRYKWKTKEVNVHEETIDAGKFLLEKFYLSLRTSRGIEVSDFFYKKEQKNRFFKIASQWNQRDLAVIDSDRVFLTSKGYLLLDSLMGDVFLAQLI